MLKNAIVVAALVASTGAFAADVPNRKVTPPAPTPAVQSYSGFYVGARGGAVKQDYTVGGAAGYNISSVASTEVSYDYIDNKDNSNKSANVVTGNFLGHAKLGPLTGYTLAGIGYRWADVKNEAIWNVGGGLKFDITKKIELDGRYRYIANFENDRSSNMFTVGVNYKF